MAVYVDEPIWEWRGSRWCHLTADTAEELHAFAARLGLGPGSMQRRPGRPWRDHYDIPERLRARAVSLGATEMTMREAGAKLIQRRIAAEGG